VIRHALISHVRVGCCPGVLERDPLEPCPARGSGGIASGQWDDVLPSESQLQAEHGVSRVTVRRAIAALADQGLVRTIRARGTFVVPKRG
jgi:hypothetical protein